VKRTLEQLIKTPRMGPNTPVTKFNNNVNGLIKLIQCVGELNDKTICEIGCFIGVSTETFLQFNPKKLYAIDTWGINKSYKECNWIPGGVDFNSVESEFREMAKNYTNIEIIKDYSHAASKSFQDKYLDLVYIDGEHTYDAVKQDIKNWLPKIKSGGFISGHDINQTGVSRAVVESFDAQNVLVFEDTSWLVKI